MRQIDIVNYSDLIISRHDHQSMGLYVNSAKYIINSVKQSLRKVEKSTDNIEKVFELSTAFSRRFFPIALVSLLSACGGEGSTSNNTQLVAGLEKIMGFGPDISQEDFADKVYQLTYQSPGWEQGVALGQMSTKYGTKIDLSTDFNTGEVVISDQSQLSNNKVEYGSVTPETFMFSDGGYNIVVYGSHITIQNLSKSFKDNKSIWTQFMKEYFSVAPSNFLHLNFLPSDVSVIYAEDKGGLHPTIGDRASATTVTGRNKDTGEVLVNHEILKLALIQDDSEAQGFDSIEAALIEALANERTNRVANNMSTTSLRGKITDEAPSSIVGYLSAFDDRWAKLACGGEAFKPVIRIIANEMRRIPKVK